MRSIWDILTSYGRLPYNFRGEDQPVLVFGRLIGFKPALLLLLRPPSHARHPILDRQSGVYL